MTLEVLPPKFTCKRFTLILPFKGPLLLMYYAGCRFVGGPPYTNLLTYISSEP